MGVAMNNGRVRILKAGTSEKGSVAYWMSREQRINDNWALLWASRQAALTGSPLAVVFCLVPGFIEAPARHYLFVLKGLKELEQGLAAKNIRFHLLLGRPETVLPVWIEANGVTMVVTDFDPLRIKKEWKAAVAGRIRIPLHEVDGHNIVPCWLASPKKEYGAYTLRPKIHRMLSEYLEEFPDLPIQEGAMDTSPRINWEEALASLHLDTSVGEVDWVKPGETAARKALDAFIEDGLTVYDTKRNDPTVNGQSGLSPYFHFGQLSPQRAALDVAASHSPESAKDAFLEELIVRRELADNYCHYEPLYDQFAAFPAWARLTLDAHRNDHRQWLYSREELERTLTHDDLWNAAQHELARTGKMHGYMRMYWAKKILEWTPSPEDALDAAIYLNDKYGLDGRDPNGYAGIAWSIGGVHDRAWNERMVFGKIRYMSYNGCKGKFDVKRYIALNGAT
jgi:deoxyribodipyrimidine photo-lyase